MSEHYVNLGDMLVMPDGERWYVIKDDSSHLFWLSNKPSREESPKSMPLIPDVEGRFA